MMVEVQEVVGISPKDFGKPLSEVVLASLKDQYEGTISEELGYIVLVSEATVDPLGHLFPRDGSTYHRCNFKLITFMPKLQEVVLGEVVEVTEFGCFLRVGPLDGLLHISQITDDFISYDEKHGVLVGKKLGKRLASGDDARARIVAVSLTSGAGGKIGLTTRQPMLGKLSWIEEEKQKGEATVSQR